MRLCFGTFAQILMICSVEKTTKTKMLNTLVQSVDETCKLPNNAITPLLQCTSNLPDNRSNGLGEVITKAQNADPAKVAGYFVKKVIPLIDLSRYKLVILALRKIIAEDDTIHGDTVIEKVSGVTKKALRKQSHFTLPNFLAGVFLYTVSINNRIGKQATEFINDEFIRSLSNAQDRLIFTAQKNNVDADSFDEAIQTYLSNIKERYSHVKTLLYNDQPRPFYSFFVPNNIEHSRGRHNSNVFRNITAKTLTDISNFIILDGTGGLGKTMMMRHLLLNTVEEYDNFHHIPVFISLKDYDESNLFDFIYSMLYFICGISLLLTFGLPTKRVFQLSVYPL